MGVFILNLTIIEHSLPIWMSKSNIQKTAPGWTWGIQLLQLFSATSCHFS